MSIELITLLHSAIVALLVTSTLGSFAASYVFWVVKYAALEGCVPSTRQVSCCQR